MCVNYKLLLIKNNKSTDHCNILQLAVSFNILISHNVYYYTLVLKCLNNNYFKRVVA